jgi:predicted branched-subunit amino acid permease
LDDENSFHDSRVAKPSLYWPTFIGNRVAWQRCTSHRRLDQEKIVTIQDSRPIAAHWSAAGLARGARLSLPVMPALAVFGAGFGAVAAQKGLTLAEATLMSALLFAGISQYVAMEFWHDAKTAAGLAALVLITATVNMRFALMSASLRPWLGNLPAWQIFPALHLLVEPGWLISMRYRTEGGSDASIYLGSGLALWLIWIAATVPGYLIGALVSDPRRFGIDLIMPAFFVAMLVPLWHGPRRAVSWLIAGIVALPVAQLVGGWWFIVAGALAGCLTAGLVDERA